MNQLFAEATTAIAFSLTLTKNQCNALLRIHEAQSKGEDADIHLWPHDVCQVRALDRRGLVFWKRSVADGSSLGFGGLTPTGRKVVALLEDAGLTVENTNGVMVLRRLGQENHPLNKAMRRREESST